MTEWTWQEDPPEEDGLYFVELTEQMEPTPVLVLYENGEATRIGDDYDLLYNNEIRQWCLPKLETPDLPFRRPEPGWYAVFFKELDGWHSVKIEEGTEGFEVPEIGWVAIESIQWRDFHRKIIQLPHPDDDDEEDDDVYCATTEDDEELDDDEYDDETVGGEEQY